MYLKFGMTALKCALCLSTLLILLHLGGKEEECNLAEVMVIFEAAVARRFLDCIVTNVQLLHYMLKVGLS